jgi:hypothetical protein
MKKNPDIIGRASRSSRSFLRPLAQHEFLDFARRRLGQRPEDHMPRGLEVGEVGAAEGDDLGGVGGGAVP